MPYSFTFGTQQFLNQSTDDALAILHLQHRNHLFRLIDNRNYHLELLKIRTEFPVVSRISNIAGLTSFPPITMWDEPERVLFLSLDAIKKYQIKLSYIFLQIAQEQLAKAQNILYEYAGKNDAGAGHAIWFFTQVKSASITTVGAVSTAITKNQLAGSAIGTGYGSLLEVIEQGMEVHYGTRDRVDWVGISSEAAWKLVFALLADKSEKISQKLADKIIEKAVGRELMMAISKDKIKQVIVKVLESKTEDVVKVVVNNTIRWAADSNPPVTWESFWNELKNQFSVNEMFWTLVESKMEFKKTKNVHLKW